MNYLTEIVFILDRSGSMAGLESDTIGGFNSMIKKQQKELEDNALVSTILFDHESIVLHDRVPLAEIKPLTEKDYEVRGTTALLDAIGDALKHIKNVHKYAREEDRPQKTLFVITTDEILNALLPSKKNLAGSLFFWAQILMLSKLLDTLALTLVALLIITLTVEALKRFSEPSVILLMLLPTT